MSMCLSSPLCCLLLSHYNCCMKLSYWTPVPSSSHCFNGSHIVKITQYHFWHINCWWLIRGIISWICDSQKKIYNLCPASASLPATTLPPLPSKKSHLWLQTWRRSCARSLPAQYSPAPTTMYSHEREGVLLSLRVGMVWKCNNLQLFKPKIELWSK